MLYLEKWSKKPSLTSKSSSIGLNIEKHVQRSMMPSWLTTRPPETNLIQKIVDVMSNESPKKTLQDAHEYYWPQLPYRKKFQSAALFMQPQCAVDRARVRHLVRHPEVNLNLLTMIDILNESPHQALQYSRKHFYLLMGRLSYNKGRKVKTGVHRCTCLNHLQVARVSPKTQIGLDYEDGCIKRKHYR